MILKSLLILNLYLILPNPTISSTIVSIIDTDKFHITASEFENEFYVAFKKAIDTNDDSDLKKLTEILTNENNQLFLDDIPKTTNPHGCLKCRALSNTFINLKSKDNKTVEYLIDQAKIMCDNLVGMNNVVCKGMVDLNAPIINFILENTTPITAESICTVVFQVDTCARNFDHPQFKIHLKDSTHYRTNDMMMPPRGVQNEHDPLVIVHITDVHYDPYYNPGGNAVCHMGVCCRRNQGPPENAASAAGQWGDYRDCDSPWEAVVDIIENVKSQYSHIDYVYFTGDIVDHFTWETTKEGNLESMRKFFKLLKDEFDGIPVFPILGNHESHPGNVYSPPGLQAVDGITSQWLFDFVAEQWTTWLPNSTFASISEEGYYTVLIRPGFRIIGLNSNVAYVHNWWLLHNSTLFTKQLQWLHDVLHAAALDNEFVHIIGHVPSNDRMCFIGWTREYRKIIEKFSYLISAQFNGHSHNDEINVYYAKDDPSQVVNVAWNGASGTPFTYLNPNYRVYTIHPATYEVLDFDTWIYNLTEANEHPTEKPRWFKEYSFKDAYNLNDLSLKSIDGLINGFATNKTLLSKYWMHKVKMADPQLNDGCDDKCLLGQLCDIVRIQFDDTTKCDELSEIFWENASN